MISQSSFFQSDTQYFKEHFINSFLVCFLRSLLHLGQTESMVIHWIIS